MDFDRVIDRRHSDSVKWNCYEESVLPMWIADMDFECSPAILAALHKRVDHGIFGYGNPPDGLYEVVMERQKRLFGWELSRQEISFVPGIVTGFNLALRAVCQTGDAVIYQTPAYPPFLTAPENGGYRSIHNEMVQQPDGSYLMDFDKFEQQIRENQVKAFILCNPQNPTGRVFSAQELGKLAEICLRHHVIIISDEIHCEFVYPGHNHIPIGTICPEVSAITISFTAPSKTFNIAGLHASVAIIQNENLLHRFCQARNGIVENPGVLALTAAEAAYRDGDAWLKECMLYLQGNRDWLTENVPLMLPGVKMAKPEATFLAWLNCRACGLENPQGYFLEKANVGLNNGCTFGDDGTGFVRFNFGTNRATIVEALERMHRALVTR